MFHLGYDGYEKKKCSDVNFYFNLKKAIYHRGHRGKLRQNQEINFFSLLSSVYSLCENNTIFYLANLLHENPEKRLSIFCFFNYAINLRVLCGLKESLNFGLMF